VPPRDTVGLPGITSSTSTIYGSRYSAGNNTSISVSIRSQPGLSTCISAITNASTNPNTSANISSRQSARCHGFSHFANFTLAHVTSRSVKGVHRLKELVDAAKEALPVFPARLFLPKGPQLRRA